RESGISICDNIKDVLSQVNCIVEDYGEVSTPEMHYLVRMSNFKNELIEKDEYINSLIKNYDKLRKFTNIDFPILIDTANGVVTNKINKLNFTIINDTNGILNEKCGADFVKSRNQLPILNEFKFNNYDKKTLFASFDGDADRLIFFTLENNFNLIDGDAQAVIIANYIYKLTSNLNIKLKIGVVLSFYSNSAVFECLKNFEVVMVQTGVKNFVSAAKKFDIGIYFEPNGHGSVIFSQNAIKTFSSGTDPEYQILKILSETFDPCVGDGLANLLIFKCIIPSTDNIKNYKENGSRLLTVKVRDKSIITVNDKNEVLFPKNLQEKIKEEIDKCGGRAFIRPSGTEDVVRIYSECPNQQDADILGLKVAQIVYDMCDGIGYHPEIDFS
ncbi:MAG: hypothetical protein ACRCZW_09240, partial [Lactobacillaceae bacterium]